MDSPLTHPYALQRRCRSVSTLSPATRSTHGPSDSEKNLGLWHPSSETNHDSVTAFVSVMGPPSNKLDVSPPAMPVHEYPYVKHNSGITVILSGHRAGTSLPLYPSGSLISGVVVLSKVESITSLDVKLEGLISVREIQGGGRSSIAFLSDQLITWNAATTRLPDEFSFRYLVPTYSRDGRLLPPTFDSRMTGVPGFRVSVKWTISVTATRALSNPLSFFRRTTRLSVPIGYVPRTRPPSRGPFPMSPLRILPSPTATLFTDIVPSRRERTPPIHTQIYLPHSQITPLTKAIPFRIVLSAPDTYLKPFLTASSPCSFLQLGGAKTPAEDSTNGHVCVRLVRRIGADLRKTGVVVVGELTTSSTRRGGLLGEGLMSPVETGRGSVSWWGEVRVRPGRVSTGGFEADGLVVQDDLVLTLNVPGVHTHTFPFRQVVPIRLTTDLPGAIKAVPVTIV